MAATNYNHARMSTRKRIVHSFRMQQRELRVNVTSNGVLRIPLNKFPRILLQHWDLFPWDITASTTLACFPKKLERYWPTTATTSPVHRVTSGPFAYCGQQQDGSPSSCDTTFTGLMRTVDYDPRQRPWYRNTKALQKPSWSAPYPSHTHSNIITRIGITYAHPFYTTIRDDDNGDDKQVFAGVLAVDYTLEDVSNFLRDNYGTSDDIIVTILEAAEPHYLIGISTGTSPYKEVQASDEDSPCENEQDECVTVRVLATDIGKGHPLDLVASRTVQEQ